MIEADDLMTAISYLAAAVYDTDTMTADPKVTIDLQTALILNEAATNYHKHMLEIRARTNPVPPAPKEHER